MRGRLRSSPLQISLANDALALVRSACGLKVSGLGEAAKTVVSTATAQLEERGEGIELVAAAKGLCAKMWGLVNSDPRGEPRPD